MSGQSTSMQMENLVDALLSDERVLTASERALVTSIEFFQSPEGRQDNVLNQVGSILHPPR